METIFPLNGVQSVAGVTQIEDEDAKEGSNGLLTLLTGIEKGETSLKAHSITFTFLQVNTGRDTQWKWYTRETHLQ